MYSLKRYFCLLIIVAVSGVAFAQESDQMGFGLDLGLGAASFGEPGEEETWQILSLMPDFAFGPFGIGIDLTFHYRFTGGDGGEFEFREEDWNPEAAGVSFLELYLPRFRYIRWGFRGDPLYIKLGSIDDATLGNGFIMGNYANTLFLPEIRIFGLNFDLDGTLFNFPYVGLQSFIGNLANPDIIGGRLFARPLAWMSMPVLPYLEIGYTMVGDIDPFRYVTEEDLQEYFPDVSGRRIDPRTRSGFQIADTFQRYLVSRRFWRSCFPGSKRRRHARRRFPLFWISARRFPAQIPWSKLHPGLLRRNL
jgi:hypothetical protein